ncbi:MAG TPA: hypothetical protein VF188_13775 [Longimicrobiales bacterium]
MRDAKAILPTDWNAFILDFAGAAGLMYGIAWFFGLAWPLAWSVVVGLISAVQAAR